MKNFRLILLLVICFALDGYGQNPIHKGDSLFKVNDLRSALGYYIKAVQMYPDSASAFSGKGTVELNMNDFTDAIADYGKVIQLMPNNSDAYAQRAEAEKLTNDKTQWQKALEDFNKAISLNNFEGYYTGRGDLKLHMLDTAGAFADFKTAKMINPKSAHVYENIGSAEDYIASYDNAIRDLSISIKLDSDNTTAYIDRGYAESWRGYGTQQKLLTTTNQKETEKLTKSYKADYAAAFKDFNKALLLEPNSAIIYADRAGLEEKMSDTVSAFKDYTESVTINPGYYRSYYHRAVIKVSIKDFDGALDDLNTALTLSPGDAESLYERGLVYAATNEKAKACADLSKASDLGYRRATDALGKYCK
jgi:tetratricopeptide (TPR) repeat protein